MAEEIRLLAPSGYRVVSVDRLPMIVPRVPVLADHRPIEPLPDDARRPVRLEGRLQRLRRTLLAKDLTSEWYVYRPAPCARPACLNPAVWYSMGANEYVCRDHAPLCECGDPAEVMRVRWRFEGKKKLRAVLPLCGRCAEGRG